MNVDDVWKDILLELKQTASSPGVFQTYAADLVLDSFSNGVITIITKNVFIQRNAPKYFGKNIESALKKRNIEFTNIQYIVGVAEKKKAKPREVVVRTGAVKPVAIKKVYHPNNGNLNERYTLDNFVLGSCNEVAVHVAKIIIERPGNNRNNPFFLYGSPGLGKTHLIQAIGNEITKVHPELTVFYTTTSNFYSDFIKHLQEKKQEEFRQFYRKLDVLIVDDFQQIAKKEASQIEFFDIFNEFYQSNRQIIVTSDRLPAQIETIDVRLSSRLSSAGEYNLEMPSFEERCAILRSKADYEGVTIEDEAIEYIADNVSTNIRDLEGEYSRLITYSEIRKMSPLELIKGGFIKEQSTTHTVKSALPSAVITKVAKFYNLSVDEMCSKKRTAHIKNARQVTMYILSKDLAISSPKIAMELGMKDHTTILHGVKKIDNDLKLNFTLRDEIAKIREDIYG